MGLFTEREYALGSALAELSYCNPFLPRRIELEKAVLDEAFVPCDTAWHRNGKNESSRTNIEGIMRCGNDLTAAIRGRLLEGTDAGDAEAALYENLVLYHIFDKYRDSFSAYIEQAYAPGGSPALKLAFYADYAADMTHFFALPGRTFQSLGEMDHLFAGFFQIRRAFHHIFDNIIGGSMAAARLRAAVWQSIFTYDMRRYQRALYAKMGDITTLIMGPSGTGKELVARAIGLSRYIPFDSKARRFAKDFTECFDAVNLSAIAPTLIEGELFGHAKGAFTGAFRGHSGLFENCAPHGTVFLDELGELDPGIQVKLLRVLQTRTFRRHGETTDRQFLGKIVAATNRDLAKAMRERRFREDLYYRLCADTIVTPSLREQLEGDPGQLTPFLRFITERVAGPDEADALAAEMGAWIAGHLGAEYPWQGNVRELEQFVRSYLVRRDYVPPHSAVSGATETFFGAMRQGTLSADDVLAGYCTLVYAKTGNYQETARRLNLDGRTVKSKIDGKLLESLIGIAAVREEET